MTFRPKFDTLFRDHWPHDTQAGVGLRLSGLPSDRDAFIAFLMEYSCHPKAGARIYERIEANGFDLLTVMAFLDFDAIAKGLSMLGVSMQIVAPLPNWTQRFNDGEFPSDFVPPHMRKGER